MSHQLYLVRHAIAFERGDDFPDDSLRPLTREGLQRWKREVAALAALDVELEVVLTSPFTRARQTADALLGLRGGARIVEFEPLAPEGSPSTVLAGLAPYASHTRIALVGHEPGMGELAARLIGTRRPVPFKKGAVCRIDVDALPPRGAGSLIWFATPRMLRLVRD